MRIFLSHSSRDRAFVNKLGERLRSEGFDPWLCEMNIAPGQSWVREMEDGLGGADLVLLVWSVHAAASYATSLEWMSALSREISERRLRLGLVRLDGQELPELLRTRQYIDARDRKAGLAAAVDWLRGRRDLGRVGGGIAPIYLPDYMSGSFIGRASYLQTLNSALLKSPSMFLLTGEPGAGKSSIALRFAWEAQREFDAVLFQSCGPRSVATIVAEMADRLKQQLGESVTRLPPEQKLQAVKDWLKQRRSLLILDDLALDHASDLKADLHFRDLLPGPPVSVLFTSRRPALPWLTAAQTAKVMPFSPEEAEAAFCDYLGRETVERHKDALAEFAERIERLPIAVAVGGDLLRRQFGPLGEAARSLAVDDLRNEIHDVPALMRRALRALPMREMQLLTGAAACVPDGFWLPFAIKTIEMSDDEGAAARDYLVNASLLRVLDRERQRFQLHGLLRQHVLSILQSLGEHDALRSLHVKALAELFAHWQTRWRECRECLAEIVPAVEFVWSKDAIDLGDQLILRGTECAFWVGELDAAFGMARCAEVFWAARKDPRASKGLLASYINQAAILMAWGRQEDAFALLDKEQAIALDSNDVYSVQARYTNRAAILQKRGRLKQALSLLRKQEALCLSVGNKKALSASYLNQARILRASGDLKQAFALCRKSEAICLKSGDGDGLGETYGQQAFLITQWGRFEDAMALCRKWEAMCKERDNKAGLGSCYGQQASTLSTFGQFQEAVAAYTKEQDIWREMGNKDALSRSYAGQAAAFAKLERLDEVVSLHRQAGALSAEMGNRGRVAVSCQVQAAALRSLGRLETVPALLETAEAIYRESDHHGLGYCHLERSFLAQAQGDKKKEKEHLEAALDVFERHKMSSQIDAVRAELRKLVGGRRKVARSRSGTARARPGLRASSADARR